MNTIAETRKGELLGQLTLNRGAAINVAAPARPARRTRRWAMFAVPLCLFGAWLYVQLTNQPAQVQVTTEQKPPPPVRSAPIRSAQPHSLQAAGYVVARQSATVGARTTAAVRAVYVEEGSFVQAGEVMAQLDDRVKRAQLDLMDSELAAARSRVAEVREELRASRVRYDRVLTLSGRQLTSQAELDHAITTVSQLETRLATAQQMAETAAHQANVYRLELEDYLIRAPFAGVVTSRSAQRGEIVSPMSAGGGFTRSGIATLVDMGSLEVEVDVTEDYISRVSAEQGVHIVLNAYPDVSYDGRVIAVIPTADRNKATIRVRIALLNADERVIPEMGVRVDFS